MIVFCQFKWRARPDNSSCISRHGRSSSRRRPEAESRAPPHVAPRACAARSPLSCPRNASGGRWIDVAPQRASIRRRTIGLGRRDVVTVPCSSVQRSAGSSASGGGSGHADGVRAWCARPRDPGRQTVNRVLERRGSVWGDRYHSRELRTPREVRNALVYVLNNWRKHEPAARGLDPRSSAAWFGGWQKPRGGRPGPSPVGVPLTWLASIGWKLRGLIGVDERPRGVP